MYLRLKSFCLVSTLMAVFMLFNACGPSGPRGEYTRMTLDAYRSMQLGDWVLYDLSSRTGLMLKVSDVSNDQVSITRLAYFSTMPAKEGITLDYRFDDIERNLSGGKDISGKIPTSDPRMGKETVFVAGQTFSCDVYTVKTPGGEIATYISNEVPLEGVVMVKRNGVIIRSLKKFGRA